jgi:hypothetical protein
VLDINLNQGQRTMKLQSRALVSTILALGFVTSPLAPAFQLIASAQDTTSQNQTNQKIPAPSGLGTRSTQAPAKNLKVPQSVQSGVALKQSLSAQQQNAIQKILQRYQPQLDALQKSFPAPVAPDNLQSVPTLENSTNARAQAAVTLKSADSVVRKALALQKLVDQEILSVLNQDQAAKFRSSNQGAQKMLEKVLAQGNDSVSIQDYTSDCYSAGYQAALGTRYAYLHYLYAYYHYFYDTSNSYAYYSYLYSDYAYYSYAMVGLRAAGATYFDELAWDYSYHGDAYNSQYNLYQAQYYAYYGYLNAYNSYIYYGGSYAYSAYYYAYYSQYYLYYAYSYAYGCYQSAY